MSNSLATSSGAHQDVVKTNPLDEPERIQEEIIQASVLPKPQRIVPLGDAPRTKSAPNEENQAPETYYGGYNDKLYWSKSAPANLFYLPKEDSPTVLLATDKLDTLCNQFEELLVKRGQKARSAKTPCVYLSRNEIVNPLRHDSVSDSSFENEPIVDKVPVEEPESRKYHPDRLHPLLWFNDPSEMNFGPSCRCSAVAKCSGIRHNIYAGEHNLIKCQANSNNAEKLYHYKITISPPINFLVKTPTVIEHLNHSFIFEGFSMFSHEPLNQFPPCKVLRYDIKYSISFSEENLPQNFTIRELDLFHEFLFNELLELVDFDLKAAGDINGCSQFHFMPRFVRQLPENGIELLSMNCVLSYLLSSSKPLIPQNTLSEIMSLPSSEWMELVDEVKGMIVTYPGKKPSSIRVDKLDRVQAKPNGYPDIVHHAIQPAQLSYYSNPRYQKAWEKYVKFSYHLANKHNASCDEKQKLEAKENQLKKIRMESRKRRDVSVTISSFGFYRTGIRCDIVEFTLLLPVLVSHLRFQHSLEYFGKKINYKFKNKSLLQLAFTHPSYFEYFGTNPDHARNSLSNCGDCGLHGNSYRMRFNTLNSIMSHSDEEKKKESIVTHNKRLEFLGDAVIDFVSTVHLFYKSPRLEENGLASVRSFLIKTLHLANILGLEAFMRYGHAPGFYSDLVLNNAIASCFRALMGALYLDGGIEAAGKVFAQVAFRNSEIALNVWQNYPIHPLKQEEPNGDRHLISKYSALRELTKFENLIGIEFDHITLLAQAITTKSISFSKINLDSNQRLEFLGDTILKLVASDYLYKYYPMHREAHLTLLLSSLISNNTQSVVCNDLGMAAFVLNQATLGTKEMADILKAFVGALYVDKGLDYCQSFCGVWFFQRLQNFIMNQEYINPKSKLQHCCLTIRTMDKAGSENPVYKVTQLTGPSNRPEFSASVYFKRQKLARATGRSRKLAQLKAAKKGVKNFQIIFPVLDYQKCLIAERLKTDPLSSTANNPTSPGKRSSSSPSSIKSLKRKKDELEKGEKEDFL